jgi:FixJ family two-component response regulator
MWHLIEDDHLMTNFARFLVIAVDDDVRIRESIESLVASAGYRSASFSSAEEFLQSGMLSEASCVITDVRMPGMDGMELQRRIRVERPELPVIFVSGYNGAEIRRAALGEGAIEFLYKPFDAAHLLEVIRTSVMNGPGNSGAAPAA